MNKSQITVALLAFSSLAICLMLVWVGVVYFVGKPSSATPSVVSLSTEVQAKLIMDHSRVQTRPTRILQFAVFGRGEILPTEASLGVQELVCYRMTFEYFTPRQEDYNWILVSESLIAKLTENQWMGGSSAVTQDEWLEHSCPGRYESSNVVIPNDPLKKYLLIR
ncbi:MAG: hypothetical protein HZB51_33330 [Chloroflexi bacterium]|nr:hypothetical protein [Chloroflexota bacterium]